MSGLFVMFNMQWYTKEQNSEWHPSAEKQKLKLLVFSSNLLAISMFFR